MHPGRSALVVVCLVLFAAPVLAHVPAFPTGNDSPATAQRVPDAAKSWSFYDGVDAGGVAYYRLELDAGDRLRFGVYTPTDSDATPSLVVMGPGVEGDGRVPDAVTVPDGMGATVVTGDRPDAAAYEPFTPAANYPTASVDRRVDEAGTYLVAVFEPSGRPTRVGVAVGHEEAFTPVEYATVPLNLVRVHRWEGDSPLLVFGPALSVLAGGVAVLRERLAGRSGRRARWAVGLAGLLFLGSSANVAVAGMLAVAAAGVTASAAVTAAFVAVPAAAGWWLVRVAVRDDRGWTRRTRAGLAAAGVAGLATWGGFVVGPLVALAAAALPPRAATRSRADGDAEPR